VRIPRYLGEDDEEDRNFDREFYDTEEGGFTDFTRNPFLTDEQKVRKFEEELENKLKTPKINPKLNQFNRDQKKWEEDRLMASVRSFFNLLLLLLLLLLLSFRKHITRSFIFPF
jgi:hypothetical protein